MAEAASIASNVANSRRNSPSIRGERVGAELDDEAENPHERHGIDRKASPCSRAYRGGSEHLTLSPDIARRAASALAYRAVRR